MPKQPRTRDASLSSSRAPEFDSSRFRSEEAEKRYEMLKEKKFTQERYLQLNTGVSKRGANSYRLGGYISTVEKLGWEGFVTPLEAFDVLLVLEFYANLLESAGDRCWVRGQWVDYSRAAINEHYQLDDREEEAETEEHELLVDTRIFDVLSLGRGIVKKSDSGTVHMTYFTRDARFWRLFIAHNLHPVSQEHEVRRESYRVLYKIIAGRYINVGSIIHRRLADWRPAVRQKLGFPHLIMALCVAAGIEVRAESLQVRPLSPFDGNYIHRRIKIHADVSEMTSRDYYSLLQSGFEDAHTGESDGEQGSLPESPTETLPEAPPEPRPEQQPPPRRPHCARGQSTTASVGGDIAQLTQMIQTMVSTQERIERMIASEHARHSRAQARLARHQAKLGHWMHTSMAQLGYEIQLPPTISPPSSDDEED